MPLPTDMDEPTEDRRNYGMERAEYIRERLKDERAAERRKVQRAHVDEWDALRNVPTPSVWH
jgi:hypothetical protein